MDECEGRAHRETEAKRVRSLLKHLRLDHRSNGYEYRNYFRGHIKRLNELQSTSSECSLPKSPILIMNTLLGFFS